MAVIRILPAILSETREDLIKKISQVEGLVDRVQVDIVGRAFSPQPSVGIETLEGVGSGLLLDVQLMVREPVTFLNRCDSIGVERVFGHVEYMQNQEEFIEHAFALGMQVGLALDLLTPVSRIEKVIEQIDALLLMAVPAGKSGQKFDPAVLPKIGEAANFGLDIPICVDGGITPSTIVSCIEAGAREFAVGSYLWQSSDIGKALGELQEVGQ